MTIAELPQEFREKAETVRDLTGLEGPARAWERAAELVEAGLRESGFCELTLEEAEVESGYTRSHLRRLIREKTLPATRLTDGSYLVLRKDLPRKPGHGVAAPGELAASSRSQSARAVATGEHHA